MIYKAHDHTHEEVYSLCLRQWDMERYKGQKEKQLCKKVTNTEEAKRDQGTNSLDGEYHKSAYKDKNAD